MKSFRKITLLGSVASMMLVSACGELDPGIRSDVNSNSARVGAALTQFGDRPSLRAGGAQLSEGVFVAATAERSNAAALLPSRLQRAGAVRLESRDRLSLPDIALRLSEVTGVQHVVALGPTGAITSGAEVARGSDLQGEQQDPSGRSYIASEPAGESAAEGIRIRPNLRGPLSEVLNELASNFEVEWTYSDGRILFQDYVTRQYQISALPTTNTGSTTIGSNEMTSSSTSTTDMWTDIRNSLQGLIGQGSNMSISSSSGLITVTAKVSDQDRVRKYVTELNGTLSQQITFDVNVMTVTMNKHDSFGLDISAAFAGTDANASTGFTSSVGQSGNTGVVNIGVVSGDFSLSAVARALSSQGKVSVNTRAGATTSNNRMVPIEVVDTIGYVSESEVTRDSDGDFESVNRTVEEATTGFQLQVLPRVMNNRDIMVQYSVKLSELTALRDFGTDDNQIQLPEISTTSFEQQAVISNGQTLVLAGFERSRAEYETQGPARPRLGIFGGSREAESTKVATVLMITPRLVNRNSAIRSGN
ncbi:MAG: hypothetical protein ABJN42_29085 [Roseibium sp.]|uniref:hypothetical protein n=1 Tax=Roseibium sp. TaxID=1936156 RepID=UPI003298339A